MISGFKSRLGDLLLENRLVGEQSLQAAYNYLEENAEQELHLADVLIKLEAISEGALMEFYANYFKATVKDLRHYPIDIHVMKQIPRKIAKSHLIMALNRASGKVWVAVSDPFNIRAQEEIRSFINDHIEMVICSKADITNAIEYHYSELEAKEAAEETGSANADQIVAQSIDFDVTEKDDTPIVKFVNSLLLKGYSATASDIHIEPFENETLIRMRIDGMITEYMRLESNIHNSLVARIKIISSMDIAEKRLPQDGHFRYRLEGKNFNIRTSIVPSVFGEKVVMRFLNLNTNFEDARQFGMREYNYNVTFKMLQNPHGIIYLTGATGSGKTTTLYMMLEYLSQRTVSISTIEDPVEKNILRVCQMQVNNAAGLTFESGLRSILRQDPDVIMVGETRDEETAAISVRAAITGHLVLSTIHTNDAASTISRLMDMKIPPYMLADSLSGIIAQRLVRKICNDCKTEYTPDENERQMLGEPDVRKLYKGAGCRVCNQTGYKGRVAVHEVMEIDNTVRHLINTRAEIKKIQEYCVRIRGMKLLAEEVKRLILDGETTTQEYLRVISTEA